MKVGIIGAGLQGKRRASVFPTKQGSTIEGVACGHEDDLRSAILLAEATHTQAHSNWNKIISNPQIDAVIVATPPNSHAEISIKAMNAGKHVLCEKPLSRTIQEGEEMIEIAKQTGRTLKCGFNHRHHPGVLQARKWVDLGLIGELDFSRCQYGIGGRPGYENEWRANPKLVSGGQLMEQGIHAIDLFRWFLGNLNEVAAFVSTMYWKIKPLEDNAFVLLRSRDQKIAELHSSLTYWKNRFSLEIHGHEGYIMVDGLGGSYGVETATLGKRDFDKPFAEEKIEYRGQDQSWKNEWDEFESAIREHRQPLGSAVDGLEAMRLVKAAYESNRTRAVVDLE